MWLFVSLLISVAPLIGVQECTGRMDQLAACGRSGVFYPVQALQHLFALLHKHHVRGRVCRSHWLVKPL
jgi:hypothetical protein